jgi:hypothetical protein
MATGTVEKAVKDSGIRPPPDRPSSCWMLLQHALRLIGVGDPSPASAASFYCRVAKRSWPGDRVNAADLRD